VSEADDPDDDPMLRSMRSVWLSMREEEPPQRGLAELMAAARVQAEAMKPKESWWRRSFALLVRPPVLALATVVVLVGGAVLVNKRGDKFDATRHQIEERQEAPAPATPPAVIRKDQEAGETGAGYAASRDGVADNKVPPAKVEAAKSDPAPPRPRARPPQTVTPPPAPEPPPPPKEVVAKPGAQLEAEKDKKSGGQSEGGLVIATDSTGTKVRDATPSTEDAAEPAPMSPTGRAPTRGPAQSQGKLLDQLVRQCEIAAGRKDCAAVRATAERIRKIDAGTYKSRVTNQKPIADCLN
jgi:hypothetical protein